ncbi:unnamed protein product [Linum tenue]|uniref:Bet v I/Major latex protein domain-containing protein n=1 Tax=Linum tenue TaxID=586396 RepID=A0AAV0M8R7_9ROSI|nr:unnamed protein product [Linum tenue]
MKLYKVYTSIFEFVAGDGEGKQQGAAKLSIEYEKRDPSVPPPTKYMNIVVLFVKEVDASLAKAG